MNIQCESWNDDIAYFSGEKILITTAKVFTQALIHSNLFDAHQGKHGNLKDLTLFEMATKHYKKPFVCAIIEGISKNLDCLCITHVLLM